MQVLKTIHIRLKQLALLAGSILLLSAQTPTREYQVKAAFLFNFTQFIEWPAGSFSSTSAPLVIGIVGKNPFGNYLEETVSGENVNGHPLVVQQYKTVEDIKNCHILFLNLTDAAKIEQALTGIKSRSVLTVSDGPNFMKQGGMVRFFTRKNKIQFQVNTELTKAANLSISSKLLRLAEIYVP
jgi:hypothetical protein